MRVPVCPRHKRGGGTSPPPAPQPGLLGPACELSPREFGGVRAAPLSVRLGHSTAVRDRGAPASRRTCYRVCGCESSFLRRILGGLHPVLRLQAVVRLRPPAPSLRSSSWRRGLRVLRARTSHVSASASLSAENRKWFLVSLLSAAGPWEARSPSPGAGSGCVARADSGLWGEVPRGSRGSGSGSGLFAEPHICAPLSWPPSVWVNLGTGGGRSADPVSLRNRLRLCFCPGSQCQQADHGRHGFGVSSAFNAGASGARPVPAPALSTCSGLRG